MEKYLNYLRKLEKQFLENNLEASAAKIILAAVLRCSPNELLRYYDVEVEEENRKIIDFYSLEYLKNKPLQYILNKSNFYYLDLYVDENVLIPRSETEELVEWILNDHLEDRLSLVDLGSGSGCINLAIKNNRPNWDVYGVDISNKALEVSIKNSKALNLNVNYMLGDFLEPIINKNIKVDIVVSNPPYIAPNDQEVSSNVREYEPALALFTSDMDGLECYEKILNQLCKIDFKDAYFEFGYRQREKLETLIKKYGFWCEFKKDISNKDRMVKISRYKK